MAHPGFGYLWQQAELSDVQVHICFMKETDSPGDKAPEAQSSKHSTLLQQFPGHTVMLSLSPYFTAQVLRWSDNPTHDSSSSSSSESRSGGRAKRQVLNITLPEASYEPAAMEVLAGMCMVQPWPVLLSDLTPQQQVHAAVLADMWQLPAAGDAALQLLKASADSAEGASEVLDALLSMEALPGCLQQLLEDALLGKFGNLEDVWSSTNATLQHSLLRLPLHAMEMLLASDKLKVASEDTVLYTAQAYADSSTLQQAAEKLAPLVRCPHLSQFWLVASVLSDDADKLLLHGLQPLLKRLLLLRPSGPGDSTSTDLNACLNAGELFGAPASWLLPVRDIQPVSCASVDWKVDVAAIRQAAEASASQQRDCELLSPRTCLLGGVMWGIKFQCVWDASKQGSTVGVYAIPRSLPARSVCRCTCVLEPPRQLRLARPDVSYGATGRFNAAGCGQQDFFEVGAMAGGFDEDAWAAKELPTAGSIGLWLMVDSIRSHG